MIAREETQSKVDQVDELRDTGNSLQDAVKQVGIALHTYYTHTKRGQRKPRKKNNLPAKAAKSAYVEDVPVEREHAATAGGKVVCIIGNPIDIAKILGGTL